MSAGGGPLLPTSRHAWVVGITAILVAGYLAIDAARPPGPGAAGLPAGERLPPFAVVLATADVDCDSDEDPCDANVAASGARDEGEAGRRTACAVRGPAVLNVCQLRERGPLVLGLMATRDAQCAGAFDRLEDLRRRHDGLQVAVVSIRGERGDLRDLVRARRWSFPVGWDRDGVLASIYGVATCPYAVVADRRGRVRATLAARSPSASSSARCRARSPPRAARAGGRSAVQRRWRSRPSPPARCPARRCASTPEGC